MTKRVVGLMTVIAGILAFLYMITVKETSRIPELVTVFAFLLLLEIVAYTDARTMTIPDRYSLLSFLIGCAAVFAMPEISLLSRVIGIFSVSVPLLLITLLVPGAFGGGDIKLMAGCGFFLGAKLCLLSLVFAIFVGGIWGIFLLLCRHKGRKEHFAFGPFLCIGMLTALFWGQEILDWYLGVLKW